MNLNIQFQPPKNFLKIFAKSVVFYFVLISKLALAGTTTITGVSGGFTKWDTSVSPSKIYGGIAHKTSQTINDFTSCTVEASCNTCLGGTEKYIPCNETSVFGSTKIYLSVTTTSTTATHLTLCTTDSSPQNIGSLTLSGAKSGNIATTWDPICASINNTANCDASAGTATRASKEFKIIEGTSASCSGTEGTSITFVNSINVTSANDQIATKCSTSNGSLPGICDVTLQEGDGKIYVTNFSKDSTYPTAGGDVVWSDLVLLSAPATAATAATVLASLSNASTKNYLSIDSTGKISKNYTDGFNNDQLYCFNFANKDITGNISYFGTISNYSTSLLCKTPSEVVGILTDKKCFIATAAYGSPMDAHVELLRNFRNKFLATSSVGRWFVKTYYKLSPPLAKLISENEFLRTITRAVLWPVIWVAEKSMDYGTNLIFWFGILISFFILFLIFRKRPGQLISVFVLSLIFFSQSPTFAAENNPTVKNMGKIEMDVLSEQNLNVSGAQPFTKVPKDTLIRSSKDIYDKDGLKKSGLYKVDREGAFYYKTDRKIKRERSVNFRIGQITAPEITAQTKTGKTYDFNDIYPTSNIMMINLDYEWQPWNKYGKLGVLGGVGFFTAQGTGHFNRADFAEAVETYTFYAIPVSLGGVYKFDFTNKQWLVPYVSGGGIYYALIERRDDNKLSAIGNPAAFAASGLMFNLTLLNKDFGFTMDSQYGIANIWLSLEYRRIQSLGTAVDMTTNFVSAGLGVDY